MAKDFIQVLALGDNEQEVFNKKLRSNKVLAKLATLSRTDDCEVAVESCGMSHYWRRECEKLGYQTVALPPRFVKAYLQGEKNDANDARAIAEAALRPNCQTVRLKSIEQQDLALIVNQREGFVQTITQFSNRLYQMLQGVDEELDKRLAAKAERNEDSRRLMSLPGIGPITAKAPSV
ncbi:transposase [Idiomarina loihiensis]|uniref:IS110 family transposase n=1 Tax=Idiomarina loihiensis TaxID=135577 RepID=UPI00384EC724